MSNYLKVVERPNKTNIESLNLTQKVNLLKLWREKYCLKELNPCLDILFITYPIKEFSLTRINSIKISLKKKNLMGIWSSIRSITPLKSLLMRVKYINYSFYCSTLYNSVGEPFIFHTDLLNCLGLLFENASRPRGSS